MRGAASRIIETVISKGSKPAMRRAMITSSLIQTFRRACEDEEPLQVEQVQHPSMELGQLLLPRQLPPMKEALQPSQLLLTQPSRLITQTDPLFKHQDP